MMVPLQVQNIFSLVDDTYKEVKTNILTDFQIGDKLNVISGPLQGRDIIVSSIKGNKILAEVDMFGRMTTTEFTKEQLYKK